MKRHLIRRTSTFFAAVLLSMAGLSLPALAATPTNDSIDSATPLGTVPGRFVENTHAATGDAHDGDCVAGSSVWFRARPTVTQRVRLSTLGSDYDTLLAVFSGPKAHRARVTCADDSFNESLASAVQVRFVAGTTYWVAVSACCRRSARGGQLVLNTSAPTPAGITATIDQVETGTISGLLLVSGTVSCATPSEFEVDLSATQRVNGGDNVARGGSFATGGCGPEATKWSMSIDSETGWAFTAGNIRISRTAFAWDGFQGAQNGPDVDTYAVTENAASLSSR